MSGHEPNPVTLRTSAGGEAVGGTFWEEVGGRPTFEKLVRAFYKGVATDPVLLPMYPEQPDLEGAIQRLTGFLEQYWGGPTTYSEERGHPRGSWACRGTHCGGCDHAWWRRRRSCWP